jgi:hypothetical protein
MFYFVRGDAGAQKNNGRNVRTSLPVCPQPCSCRKTFACAQPVVPLAPLTVGYDQQLEAPSLYTGI